MFFASPDTALYWFCVLRRISCALAIATRSLQSDTELTFACNLSALATPVLRELPALVTSVLRTFVAFVLMLFTLLVVLAASQLLLLAVFEDAALTLCWLTCEFSLVA